MVALGRAPSNPAAVTKRTLLGVPAWVVLGQVLLVNSLSMGAIVGLVLVFELKKPDFEWSSFIYGYAACWGVGAVGWLFAVMVEDRWWRIYGTEITRAAALLRFELSPLAGLWSTCTMRAASRGRMLEVRFHKSARLMTSTILFLFDVDSSTVKRRQPPVCPDTAEEIAALIRQTAREEGFELPGIDARLQAI
jgi:hypothetical protein